MRKCIDAYHLHESLDADHYNVSADRLAHELADIMFDLNSAVKDGVGPRERYLREAAYVLTRAVRDVELGVSIHNERARSQPRIEGPVWVALSKKRAAVEELLENPGLAAEPQQVSAPKEEWQSATSEDVELAVKSYHHATRFYTDSFSIHEWERQSRALRLSNEQFVTGLRKILVE
jgi:catechol-2,3-dioxygenase